jgi:hypothetical protein
MIIASGSIIHRNAVTMPCACWAVPSTDVSVICPTHRECLGTQLVLELSYRLAHHQPASSLNVVRVSARQKLLLLHSSADQLMRGAGGTHHFEFLLRMTSSCQ